MRDEIHNMTTAALELQERIIWQRDLTSDERATIRVARDRLRRQELWCHDCENYVQFTVDLSLDGNHVLNCLKCGHEHCRVVKDGVITDIRWDSRNGPTFCATNAIYSSTMIFSTSSTAMVYLTIGY